MRIFNVTLTRTMDVTIAASDEAELELALENSRYDFEDWNPPEWEWDAEDHLSQIKTEEDLDKYPDEPPMPHMGVCKKRVLASEDCPDIMAEIEATIRNHKQAIVLHSRQMKLPGV